MTVFVMKWDLAYPGLRVSDHIVRGRSVFLYGQSPTLQEKKVIFFPIHDQQHL